MRAEMRADGRMRNDYETGITATALARGPTVGKKK